MTMFENCKFICAPESLGTAPIFRRTFKADAGSSGSFTIGGLGTYDVFLNGIKIGGEVLAPGWQDYENRICTTVYSLENLKAENTLSVLLTSGWYSGRINRNPDDVIPRAIIGEIKLGGNSVVTDESWEASASIITFADIYDGIIADANIEESYVPVEITDYDTSKFVPDTTVPTKEFDTVYPCTYIVTPKGEKVLDFGINMVGYPVLDITAKKGERVCFSFAEILDHDGNFYNENYRSALCKYEYTCRNGKQQFTPRGTFFGWRYLRVDEFPESCDPMDGCVTARFLHADMKRTGNIRTGDPLVNRLFDNVIRGQLGNYLSVPTDCPQRDERRGWTGDAQIFVKAGAYNYDVKKFFNSWLIDVVSSQTEKGAILTQVPYPHRFPVSAGSLPRAAWSDAIAICPWEIYMVYGDTDVLSLTFDAMKKHVDYIGQVTTEPNLFCGRDQYGDWLGLDAPEGSYKGASSFDVIASAYYAKSTEILVESGKLIGRDVAEYEELYKNIKEAFSAKFESALVTQTECSIALRFGLVKDRADVTRRLVEKIHSAGDKLETGFVGTPYILHALSENGESELAYKLLLNTEFPSWLYPVTMGATTMWEHWDGIRPDGHLWSKDMNSYNHYAYGAVADWLYSTAGGIYPDKAGYEHAVIAPHPDKRLGTINVTFDSVRGRFESSWYYEGDTARYCVTTPVDATVVIEGRKYEVKPGTYVF